MDLKIFFDIVDEQLFKEIEDYNSIFNNIHVYHEKFPEWKKADIALIGLTEDKGTHNNKGVSKAADTIRQQLYRLKKGSGKYKFVDLGNLRCGVNLEDTYLRIKEVGEILLKFNVLPVFIGSSHDMDYGQYLAYESFETMISVLNTDAILDMEQEPANGACQSHTNQILIHEPNYLFNFSTIGYQSYLNDTETLEALEKLYFTNYRIGEIRDNFKDIEPVIREADMLSFDITAIRKSDAPGNNNGLVFGLSGEEACQIAWYAGLNDKLTSLGIYEYNPDKDIDGATAMVIATMIWYFTEGYYQRRNDFDFSGKNYMRYMVALKEHPFNIIFYKSIYSDKWWMEVPYPQKEGETPRISVIPSTYTDYQTALNGEVPNRWINTHAKLV